jgi:hypothetical protein
LEAAARRAEGLAAEGEAAEARGDLEAAALKARAVASCYLSVMETLPTLPSSGQPADREGAAAVRSLIATAIDRAKSLDARARAAGAERRRAEAAVRRQRAMAELLATEEAYHARLQRMRAGYLEPLEAELRCLRPLLSRAELDALFGNLDHVLQHSAALLEDLRPALASDSQHHAPANPAQAGGGGGGGGHLRFGPYPPPLSAPSLRPLRAREAACARWA